MLSHATANFMVLEWRSWPQNLVAFKPCFLKCNSIIQLIDCVCYQVFPYLLMCLFPESWVFKLEIKFPHFHILSIPILSFVWGKIVHCLFTWSPGIESNCQMNFVNMVWRVTMTITKSNAQKVIWEITVLSFFNPAFPT